MAYDPSQERDKSGKWTDDGGGGSSSDKAMRHLDKLAPGVNVNPAQLANDPDLDKILANGALKSGKGKVFPWSDDMVDGQCHWNTAKLYKAKAIDTIVIGVVHSPQQGGGWYQHTWGLKNGKIVETTSSNSSADKYFGVALNKAQSAKFVKNLTSSKYAPGNGMVRTKTGGGYLE